MSDLVIVKVKDGVNIKADMMGYWRKEIMKQKEIGVIVLPWFLTAVTVPEDTEIQFEKGGLIWQKHMNVIGAAS